MCYFEIIPIASFLVLIILISGRVMFLKLNGVKVSSGSAKGNKSQLFRYILFVPILFLWLFELVKTAFQISFSVLPESYTNFFAEPVFLKFTGIFNITAALVLMTLALLHFKNSLRFGLDKKNNGLLITAGIFSVTRNPFFLSLDLYFLGIALLLPNLFFIGFSVLVMVSIHFFILKEENFMMKVYGAKYEKYRQQVGRYF